MLHLLATVIRFVALVIGAFFAAVGIDSPVDRWANPETTEAVYEDAQREFDAILGSAARTGTSTVLEAIVRAADGPALQFEEPRALLPIIAPAPSATTTPAPQKPAPLPAPKPAPQPTITPTPKDDLSDIIPTAPESTPRSFVVRISCVRESGRALELQNGSGVIISADGYVITNSHVAFPIDEGAHDCIVTQAANPTAAYRPEIVFISNEWKREFAADMRRGILPAHNGENDVAILKLVESANPAIPLPKRFPYAAISSAEPRTDLRIETWGYPAARTGSLVDDLSNPIVRDSARIAGVYSFASGESDVFETTKTATARQGSSGGAVLDANGSLIGLTAAIIERDGESSIIALTIPYVRTLLREQGFDPNLVLPTLSK